MPRTLRPAKINPEGPVWLQPGAEAGSAVRHVASLSSRFDRVEWVPAVGKKKVFSIGELRAGDSHSLVEEVWSSLPGRKPRHLGSLKVFSHRDASAPGAQPFSTPFSIHEQEAVRRIAAELGEQWPQG